MSISPKRSRNKDIEEQAEYLAQTRGGDKDDWIEKITPIGHPFDDKYLIKLGYKHVKTYDFLGSDGYLMYQSLRYHHSHVKGEKVFVQQHRDPDTGDWIFGGGPIKVVYRWPSLIARPDEKVYVTEGEKDADRLEELSLLATTVAGQNWSETCAEALRDRDVIVLEDNDEAGRDNAEASVKALSGTAKSIRVLRLPNLPHKGDVSDWLDAGHTKDELEELACNSPEVPVDGVIFATAYDFPAEESIEPYDWLLGRHLARGETSGTAAKGGTGKSNLSIVEALSMASGRKLLHDDVPKKPLTVVLINLEDKRNTMDKRIAACMRQYNLTKEDIGDRLIVLAKGDIKVKVARQLRSGDIERNEKTIKALIDVMIEKHADVLSIDSFIRTHGVSENDNSAIQAVVECFEDIAEGANCAVHLWHHTKKLGGERATVEALRGAQAFIDSCRSIRILETMTTKEREDLLTLLPDIEEPGWYFRAFNGKRNFAPPAEQSDWYKYENIRLRNYTSEFEDDGDYVGVVTRWQYPEVEVARVSPADIEGALARVRAGGPWRKNPRSTSEPWVGVPIAEALRLDLMVPATRRSVVKLVKNLLEAGRLREVPGRDAKRNPRNFVEAPLPQ
jgi:AAA domain